MLQLEIKQALANLQLDFELSIELNGCTAIVGSSGSGKSTLLRIIAGLEYSTENKVYFQNQIWQDKSIFIAPHLRKISYVSQDAYLFPHLNVLQNLQFAEQRNTPNQNFLLAKIIDDFKLNDLLMRMPARLSGGEKQKVALAQSLLTNPQLLLLDEPFSALDSKQSFWLLDYLKQTKLPTIFVSHAREEILHITDNIINLDNGKLLGYGSLNNMLNVINYNGIIIDIEPILEQENGSTMLFSSTLGIISLPIWQIKDKLPQRLLIPKESLLIINEHNEINQFTNTIKAKIVAINNSNPHYTELKLNLEFYQLNFEISHAQLLNKNLHLNKIIQLAITQFTIC